jgi:hypothetical protein
VLASNLVSSFETAKTAAKFTAAINLAFWHLSDKQNSFEVVY